MLSAGNNLSRGTATSSSDMPHLSRCLPLEPITLGNQKYTRSGELRRVLGVPLGSAAEGHSFGIAHQRPPPPVATEELKHFKESVQDASRKARDRAKMLRESLFKLDKYRDAFISKKRKRTELSLNERSNRSNVAKMGCQMQKSPHDMTQRLEDRAKSVGLNKRFRTSMADVQADGRPPVLRQQISMERGADVLQDASGGTLQFEEKIRKLPTGDEGWDTKNKKKRSIGVVKSRVTNAARDLKRAINVKMSSNSKLRSSDAQAFRSNIHQDNLASSPNAITKAKVSRAPRTGSIMMLDSTLKGHSSSVSHQGSEQPRNSNKVLVSGAPNNHKLQLSADLPSHAMARWVGQRPHKNSRTRRANMVAPISNHVEAQNSYEGFPTSVFSFRTSSFGAVGSVVGNSTDNNIPKFKREIESVPSPFGLSESEESGAGENKPKDKGVDGGEVAPTATQKVRTFPLPTRKYKLPSNEIGDGVRRKGQSRRGSTLTRPETENLPTIKPLLSVKLASDQNKSKTGCPPSKKLKDQKALVHVGPILNSSSLDFTGESDDREELFVAANSARNASNAACSGAFWKQMESLFACVRSEDMSYLKQQINFVEELDETVSQMLGIEYNVLGVLVHKEIPGYSDERQRDDSNLEPVKTASWGRVDMRRSEKGSPLYQRVLSALIEEGESEEFYTHSEGKHMPLHYASDDSHCGSCNLIDIEPQDRDRMESEVESEANFQTQSNCLLDRLSCDKSVTSNTSRNANISSSLHKNGQWVGDDLSQSDVGHAGETCSNDLCHLQMKELNVPGFPSSDHQHQLMSLDDRLLLELQSIGLSPETLPDLADGGELINQDIMELREGMFRQVGRKKQKLDKINNAIQRGRDLERRSIEHVAIDQLIEMAYRKRLTCRGNNTSKSAVRKASKQVALAFVKSTLARCRKFEDTGSSCFCEPALQEVIFSMLPCNNDAKSVDCVVSGTASNTCNEVSYHNAEVRGSGGVSSRYDSHSDNLERGKKREALTDDVIGSASSMVTSTLDSAVLGGVKGKEGDRDRDLNKDILRINSVSGACRSSLDGFKREHRTKSKPKQQVNDLSPSGNGPQGSTHSLANGSSKKYTVVGLSPLVNIPHDASKEADEPIDFANLQLREFDSIELGVTNDLGGQPDLGSWLHVDEDSLQDHYSIGLEVPMDDLDGLNMLMHH